ncbi:MAG: tetratricopeptide repeat protein [Proteobacteria bacterium]|nr:tetratricopeptide repeat protein [Pseudomonadota bacterium]
MIITERFVFIHLHKTGGQTLNDIITRCIPDNRVIGYHYPRSEIPADSADLPVVGLVRNPWDWYVSWYAFNRRPKISNQLFNVVSDSGQGTFKSTITNLINLGSDSSASKLYRDDLIRLLPDSLAGNRAAGLTKGSIRDFSSNETGYYSWLTDRMLGNANDDQTFIGRFENLQDDFLAIMLKLSVEETEALRTDLDKRERKNVSRHSHYSHYYDDELQDLVARKEQRLIERYDYGFESIKPPGVAYEFPADLYTGANRGFRKLLGRESNYLQLHHDFDVGALRNKIEQIPAAKWLESGREKLFAVHKDTQSLILVLFEDFKHEKPDYLEPYFDLQNELRPLVDYVASYYQNNGFIVRLLLAKLLAGGKIPHHTDAGFSLLNCHRVHIPIITNDQVIFAVGGEEINMQVGEFWEINNGVDHAVENRSNEDRIHIIIDWMPNYAGQSQEEALTSDDAGGRSGTGVPKETMDAMIAQAYKVHQSGQAARAESLYRQVLHADANNVVANNLFGLLCLQTKRFDEAAYHIEKALAESPDDAQAHSNLGIALKDLGRPEEAERHFHESLKLDPNNPKVYNNLGSIYMVLRRIDDAIRCFQQSLAIQPASAEVHYNLGSALLHLQRYTEAVASLQQSLALKPDYAEGRIKLEQALQGLGNQQSTPHNHV